MALSHQSNQRQVADADPLYRQLHRAFFAVCLLLAPLTLALWFGLCPTGAADASCPDQGGSLAVFAAFRAMNPQLMQLFLLLSLVAAYVSPCSYIALGRLAMKRAPWLATLGVACGFAGSIVWGPIAGQIALLFGMAQIGANPIFVTIEEHYYSNWTTLAFAIGWALGHLLGYALLGVALARARVVPQWAAWLLVVSALVIGPIAYGTGLGQLQILGYGLVFVASAPAAFATFKGSGEVAAVEVGSSDGPRG
jgi:hypothetical protein